MVFWEAVVVMQPLLRREELTTVIRGYLSHVLRNGGVVRKFKNEGVMRMHTGMYAGPQDKRRMYVPFKHRWRIHEPVDERMWFHGRYVVVLFDCNLDTAYSLQSMIYNNNSTLTWQLRQKDKHHPVALLRDPHEFEIGHDLENPDDDDALASSSSSRRRTGPGPTGQRWTEYLTREPPPSHA
eukprot:Hpha_TRINITY_DN3108_c0_g1::TRINITY_DN3108_c0_g1_i1::g.96587::m.96587